MTIMARSDVVDDSTIRAVRGATHPLVGGTEEYAPLLEMSGGARVVLVAEASHGTHEFYRERARIIERLIREKGSTAVTVEPLEGTSDCEAGEVPETSPTGI